METVPPPPQLSNKIDVYGVSQKGVVVNSVP